ncbi:polyprenyl synthetase family protein [Paenibacillus xanthanilyticus]|uniref:Polyprenyl synthetase family protein n=1 Tax=Paenibacillus xanthanilyticus TaxID=1783531 RepID=A0ABV8JV89_9BACL
MESLVQPIESELRSCLSTYFVMPQLREHAQACVEAKLGESLLFGKMTVLHYRMFAGEDDRIYRAAAAVELMILSLDIIDDLQDRDNQEVPWSRFAPEIALNIALGFLTVSQKLLLTSGFPLERVQQAVQVLNRQVLTAIHGQTTDLLNAVASEEEYVAMIAQKSAALLVSACMIGTLLATGEWVEQVRHYAEELGIAAQIKNDIRDLLCWDRKNDFLNRKRTLPTLYLLQSLAEEDQWVAHYFEGRLPVEEILHRREEWERVLEKTGTLLYTSVRMRTHYYRYLELVGKLNLESGWKEQMLAFAE